MAPAQRLAAGAPGGGARPHRGARAGAAARVFEILDELMPRLPDEILAAELRERLRAGIARHGTCHRIIAGADGELQMIPVAAGAGAPVPFEAWRILRLDPAGARTLQAELAALRDRHEARQQPTGRPFLVHAAMVLRGGQDGARSPRALTRTPRSAPPRRRCGVR